jgi:hypothetical protein
MHASAAWLNDRVKRPLAEVNISTPEQWSRPLPLIKYAIQLTCEMLYTALRRSSCTAVCSASAAAIGALLQIARVVAADLRAAVIASGNHNHHAARCGEYILHVPIGYDGSHPLHWSS